MNTRILRLLNADEKDWWYHLELRKQGNAVEARKRERRGIKDTVQTIQEAITHKGHLVIRGNAWTLHASENHSLSGYGIDRPLVQAFHVCGF